MHCSLCCMCSQVLTAVRFSVWYGFHSVYDAQINRLLCVLHVLSVSLFLLFRPFAILWSPFFLSVG